jgi:hypothetical protein
LFGGNSEPILSPPEQSTAIEDIAMMRQQKSKLVFLRLALGVEMLLSSILVCTSYTWGYVFSNQAQLVIWSTFLAFGGVWLFLSSITHIHDSDWFYPNRKKEFRTSMFMSRFSIVEFFYCGAVWGGIWWESLVNPGHHFLDILAPVNVGFLLLLAFKDAVVKREKAVVHHETPARKATAKTPCDRMADPVRVRTERVRG